MATIKLPASYYREYDADYTRDVPAEGYQGWDRADVELSLEHTAVVVMHAWAAPQPGQFPGEMRAVEYIPRAQEICRTVLPPWLVAVRASPMRLFHVVGGGDYYKALPGYVETAKLAGPSPKREQVPADPTWTKLRQFRGERIMGAHNLPDIQGYFRQVDFDPNARPVASEPIAEDTHQLAALCLHHKINHLIYAGFAVDWCLLMSPGGMADIRWHGVMCSVLRQATTAVENKVSARQQLCKEIGLWRVAIAFGFVFDVPDLVQALRS